MQGLHYILERKYRIHESGETYQTTTNNKKLNYSFLIRYFEWEFGNWVSVCARVLHTEANYTLMQYHNAMVAWHLLQYLQWTNNNA